MVSRSRSICSNQGQNLGILSLADSLLPLFPSGGIKSIFVFWSQHHGSANLWYVNVCRCRAGGPSSWRSDFALLGCVPLDNITGIQDLRTRSALIQRMRAPVCQQTTADTSSPASGLVGALPHTSGACRALPRVCRSVYGPELEDGRSDAWA